MYLSETCPDPMASPGVSDTYPSPPPPLIQTIHFHEGWSRETVPQQKYSSASPNLPVLYMQKQEEYENNWCWKQLLNSFLSDELIVCYLVQPSTSLILTFLGGIPCQFGVMDLSYFHSGRFHCQIKGCQDENV